MLPLDVPICVHFPSSVRQGKYAEAGPLCERALAIDEKVYGKTHPQVAFDVTNLAALLEAQVRAMAVFEVSHASV